MRFDNYLTEAEAKTDFYETASVIGAICSDSFANKCKKIVYDPKNAKAEVIESTLNEAKALLGGSYDWSTKGSKQVKLLNAKKDIDEITILFALIVGMNTFMKEVGRKVVGGKPQFIHNRIKDYYEVEKEVLGKIVGSKANTADCIIGNASADAILAAMRVGPIEPDESLQYIKLGKKVKILQVSLKKSAEGAQLGKITVFLKQNLGYGEKTATAAKILSNETDYVDLLKTVLVNEGLWDKAVSFAKDLWGKFSSAIKKAMDSFTGKWIKLFRGNPPSSYVNDFFTQFGPNQNLTEKKITAKTEAIVDNISSNPSKAVKLINNEVKRLKNAVLGDKSVFLDVKLMSDMKKIKGDDYKVVFTLISNYCTLRALVDMVADERSTGETVNRLVGEMLYGGTKLPLWKVYGDFGDGHAYVYLGTLEAFLKGGGKTKSGIEVLGIRISPHKSGEYYVIAVAMLESISKEGKTYIILRTGTNSSSSITFIFEGTTTKTVPLSESISKVISKK